MLLWSERHSFMRILKSGLINQRKMLNIMLRNMQQEGKDGLREADGEIPLQADKKLHWCSLIHLPWLSSSLGHCQTLTKMSKIGNEAHNIIKVNIVSLQNYYKKLPHRTNFGIVDETSMKLNLVFWKKYSLMIMCIPGMWNSILETINC